MTFASQPSLELLSLHARNQTIHGQFIFSLKSLGMQCMDLFLLYHTFALSVVCVCCFDHENIEKNL